MGSKKVTMVDVAREAGVSQSTVSLILNGKGSSSFSPETVQRVKETVQRMGYHTKGMLNAGSGSGSPYIMVISIGISNPYYGIMQQNVEEVALAHRYHIISCNTYRSASLEENYLDLALKMQVAGIVFLCPPHAYEKVREVAKQLPVVCVCDRDLDLPVDIVEMDHAASAQIMVDHLVSLGHRRIGMITTPLGENKGRLACMDGIRVRMEKHGLGDLFSVHMPEEDREADLKDYYRDYHCGHDLMQDDELYKKGITAFICINDSVAMGAMDAIVEKGYRIPEDFSVCGFDNHLYSALHTIALTTVDHRMNIKGKSAIDLLLRKIDLMKDHEQEEMLSDLHKIEYQPRLVVRSSTGPVPKGAV